MARLTRIEYNLGRGAKAPSFFRGKKADMTLSEMIMQIERLPRMLDMATLNYTVAVARRALVVFQHSFKARKFYSSGETQWRDLSEYTKRRREKRGKWPGNGILREFDYLYKSIKIKGMVNNSPQSVVGRESDFRRGNGLYAATVHTDERSYKKNKWRDGVCYAGYHNDPRSNDTYGNGWGGKITPRPIIQRKFMGFSTNIDNFEKVYIDRYLFHQIFNRPGGGLMSEAGFGDTF